MRLLQRLTGLEAMAGLSPLQLFQAQHAQEGCAADVQLDGLNPRLAAAALTIGKRKLGPCTSEVVSDLHTAAQEVVTLAKPSSGAEK